MTAGRKAGMPARAQPSLAGFTRKVAEAIRAAVLPSFGHRTARAVIGTAASGDATFQIDRIAEQAAEEALRHLPARVACYSEDRGMAALSASPEWLFIIDPIDGTRPAAIGFEQACVSVAVCRYTETPVMEDILAGCVLELRTGRCFTARRGHGAAIDGTPAAIPDASPPSLDRIFWGFELVGRPAHHVMDVLAPLIDLSSVQAGVFVLNSSAYALTRLAHGQFDAYVDVGGWLLRHRPESRAGFIAAGRGRIIGLFPYDIAAAALIVQEAGGVITDASGESLGGVPLLDTTARNVLSCVAARTPAIHQALIRYMRSKTRK